MKSSISYLFLLHLKFNLNRLFLVFASLVLEPNADNSLRKSRHLDKLLLDECIGSGIQVITSSKHVELLLVQHCSYTCGFSVAFV